jgi:hypothetical protein
MRSRVVCGVRRPIFGAVSARVACLAAVPPAVSERVTFKAGVATFAYPAAGITVTFGAARSAA